MSAIANAPATLENSERPARQIHWPAIIAGAIAAEGVSLTLTAFAAGIGLSVSSTAPTWRDSSSWLWLLSGIYLLFVALCSFGVGGYIAGRMRAPLSLGGREMEFRDGIHGLITWGLAAVMAAILALGFAATAVPTLAVSAAGHGASVTGESLLASELDELFRSNRNIADIAYRRAEASRILLKSSGHSGIGSADRDYLTGVTAAATGISDQQAEERVTREIAASRQELHRARVAAVLQAFFIAVAMLVGAVVAWYAACEGGKEREQGLFPAWGPMARR